jgi:hypothetical protein
MKARPTKRTSVHPARRLHLVDVNVYLERREVRRLKAYAEMLETSRTTAVRMLLAEALNQYPLVFTKANKA